ncbi:MAG: DNA repair protein RadC [Patescibacteria group bacterium]|nr:DNA repair protein RadC [Patescibacteria group bacterium]
MERTYIMNQPTLYTQHDNDLVLDAPREKEYRIKDLPAEEKPREKLLKYGPGHLSAVELFAVLLNVGTMKEDVLSMSRRLIKEYGDTGIANQKDPKKLESMLGIPLAKACQVVACFELGRRFFQSPTPTKPAAIRTPSQVFEYLKEMRDLPKEHLRGIYLDSHYQVIHNELISVGSLNSNIIHPREVFRPALEFSASAIILAHNHPSGIAKASEQDILITRQIIEAGKILGISVLDHVIIAKENFESVPVEYN